MLQYHHILPPGQPSAGYDNRYHSKSRIEMAEKLKDKLFSENGMRLVNGLFIIGFFFPLT